MGKLTLMIVAAAILGGATLKLGMDLIAGDTAAGRAESQKDVLARQIAETGQSVALALMVSDRGFINPGNDTRDYEGGTYNVRFANLSADSTAITVTVEGRYGGAVHTIQSTYAFDPMEYPGPIWLDVPYATADIASGSDRRVSGTLNDHPARYDQRKFEELGLGSYGMNRASMESNLQGQLGIAGGALSSPPPNQWVQSNGTPGALVEDLSQDNSVTDGEGLYQAALSSMDAGDVTFPTAQVLGGNTTWGGPEKVTRVQGDLTVRGQLTGSGVLIVEGVLDVLNTGNSRLDWDGIVIVRADRQFLPVKLNGSVDIAGSLVVVQSAFPPGGHMDLTVMRNTSGMTSGAQGRRPSPNWPSASPVDFPWWEHTHRFDLEPVANPRRGHVEFARNGRGAQEGETQFWTTLQALGSERVYLEFAHHEAHGFSRFTLGLQGEPEQRGAVRSGFGALAAPGNAFRSQPFEANNLRTLMLDVQSLRALRARFDGQGSCDGGSWPFCIGRSWDRAGALSVRLVRARDNTKLYDAALYWHMKADERAQHEAEEAAWLSTLATGGSFGTHLEMGPRASVHYNHGNIVRLSDKLSFDGNEVRLVSSVSEHVSAAELHAALASGVPNPSSLPPASPPAPPVPPSPAPPVPPSPAPSVPPSPAPSVPPSPTPTMPTPGPVVPGPTPLPTPPPETMPAPEVPTYTAPSSWNPSFYVCHTKNDGKVKSEKINNENKYNEHVLSHHDPVRAGSSCPDD